VTFKQKFWYDPRYGAPIKFENLGRRGGTVVVSLRRELTSIKADRS
jgi:hypothetical protein